MKSIYFLTFLALLALQVELIAQPNNNQRPSPQLENNNNTQQDKKDYHNYDDDEEEDEDDKDDEDDNGNGKGSKGHNKDKELAQSLNQSIHSSYQNGSYSSGKPTELRSNQKSERTLSILKPDALQNKHIGHILSRFEDAGLRIVALKMVNLTPQQAAQFYQVHRDRPFFPELIKFMSSGPVIVLVLEGDQAVSKNRQLMGATDPKKAEKGTIRADFAESVSQNSVHGSDSPEAAKQEIYFFFKPEEIYSR